jgi:hypothetical protein
MQSGEHVNGSTFFLNSIEKPPSTNPVPPDVRILALQSVDIIAPHRVRADLFFFFGIAGALFQALQQILVGDDFRACRRGARPPQ